MLNEDEGLKGQAGVAQPEDMKHMRKYIALIGNSNKFQGEADRVGKATSSAAPF